jgi:hypothetical protein
MSHSYYSIYVEPVKSIVEKGKQTDKIITSWLPVLSFLIQITGFFILFSVAASLAQRASITPLYSIELSRKEELRIKAGYTLITLGAPLFISLLYILIRRRDDHFSRSLKLMEHVKDSLRAAGLANNLAKMEEILTRLKILGERNPGLWVTTYLVVSLFSGILGWSILFWLQLIILIYILHFLTSDFAKHEEYERQFFYEVRKTLWSRQIDFEPPQITIEPRNKLVYSIVSLITFGLFTIYWLYVVTADPNKHFYEHRRFEPSLIEALEQLFSRPITS